MKKIGYAIAAAILAILSACGPTPQPPQVDANGQPVPQQQSNSMNPWLAGGLGFLAGRMTGGGSHTVVAPAPAPVVNHTTVVKKTVVVNNPPPKPAPAVKPSPIRTSPRISTPSYSSSRSFSSGRTGRR